tara:strand:- start:1082 stop:1264 length:183 start_codon:yes stop_codon:yes gene_type:complete
MFNALDINTKAIIATGTDRRAIAATASKLVGNEGYCIRAASPAPIKTPGNWCTSDGQWWV